MSSSKEYSFKTRRENVLLNKQLLTLADAAVRKFLFSRRYMHVYVHCAYIIEFKLYCRSYHLHTPGSRPTHYLFKTNARIRKDPKRKEKHVLLFVFQYMRVYISKLWVRGKCISSMRISYTIVSRDLTNMHITRATAY